MNLVKTLKSAAAISAVALSFVSAPSFATVGLHADASLGVKTCRNGSECTDPNGPSLDGFAGTASQAPSIRTCTKTTAECADPNGPSLDGFVGTVSQAPSIRTCTKNSVECSDPNGPSLDGFVAPVQPVTNLVHTVGKN